MIDRKRVHDLAMAADRRGDEAGGGGAASEEGTHRRPGPAVAPRPWREPYEILESFVMAESEGERGRLQPMVPRACRELRRRTYYLKRNILVSFPDADSSFRVDGLELEGAIKALDHRLQCNEAVDAGSRARIRAECMRILAYKGAGEFRSKGGIPYIDIPANGS